MKLLLMTIKAYLLYLPLDGVIAWNTTNIAPKSDIATHSTEGVLCYACTVRRFKNQYDSTDPCRYPLDNKKQSEKKLRLCQHGCMEGQYGTDFIRDCQDPKLCNHYKCCNTTRCNISDVPSMDYSELKIFGIIVLVLLALAGLAGLLFYVGILCLKKSHSKMYHNRPGMPRAHAGYPAQPSMQQFAPPQTSMQQFAPAQPSIQQFAPPQPGIQQFAPPQPGMQQFAPPQPGMQHFVPPQPSMQQAAPPPFPGY